eukprot:TRINITY_DN3485_c0_g1_i1.p1 TRINITY_DN3485_c0_g1~~TRINITY_DN3485_c0_g1_i1.p1  ORF type:complete len:2266 (+),score=263.03 TRINITY_DN3485_c0_g1_i1:3212-10009(+)
MNQKITGAQLAFRKVNAFLCYWMYSRLKVLGTKTTGDSKILAKLFKKHKKYYDISSLIWLYTTELDEDIKEVGVTGLNREYYTWISSKDHEKILTYNINIFGQLRGFESVRNGIANSESLAEYLPVIRRWIKAVVNMSEFITRTHLRYEVFDVCKAGLSYLTRMDDEELSNAKDKEIRKILGYAKRILKLCETMESELCEEFERELSFKLLNLPHPEKHLFGIDIILGQLSAIKDKWPEGYVYYENPAKKLVKWLENKKFYEAFLSKELHVETIKKVGPILELMYAWEVVKGKEVIQLWKIALSANKTLQKAILALIETMAVHFGEKDAKRLFQEIQQLPLSEFNEGIGKLIVALCKNEYYRKERYSQGINYMGKSERVFVVNDPEAKIYYDKEGKDLVLKYLWELLQNSKIKEGLQLSVQNMLLDSFVSLLQDLYKTKREGYLKECEKKIFANESFIQCSKIYMRIVESLPDIHTVSVKNCFEKILLETVRMKKNAVEHVLGPEEAKMETSLKEDYFAENENCENKVLAEYLAKMGYYSELEQRFDFMAFLVTKLKESIEEKDVKALWESFLTHAISIRETEIFFRFIHKLISSNQGSLLIQKGVFDSFFFEILLKHDPHQYNEPELACFLKIFTVMNSTYKRLTILPNNTTELSDSKLIGIDCLWEIAFLCSDDQVQHKACDFLKNLYSNFAPHVDHDKRNCIAEVFIEKCMSRISTVLLQSDNPQALKEAVLALELLNRYLREFSIEPPSNTFALTFQATDSNMACVTVTPHTKVVEALETGLTLLGFTSYKLKSFAFICEGRELMPTDNSLEQSGILTPTLIEVKEQYDPLIPSYSSNKNKGNDELKAAVEQLIPMFSEEDVEVIKAAVKKANNEVSEAVIYLTDENIKRELQKQIKGGTEKKRTLQPTGIMGKKKEYFELLYQLLDVDELAEKAWDALALVPMDGEVQSQVICFYRSEDWRGIIMKSSPYKIAYILQVLDNCLLTVQKDETLVSTFVENDGIDILLDFVVGLTSPFIEQSEIKNKGAEVAIRVLKKLLEAGVDFISPETYAKYFKLHNTSSEVTKLTLHIQNKIAEKVTSPELIRKLIHTLQTILNENKHEKLVEEGLKLVHLLPIASNELIDSLFLDKSYVKLLMLILASNLGSTVKEVLIKEIKIMIKLMKPHGVDKNWPKLYYLERFLEILFIPDKGLHNCDAYFSMLEKLVELYSNTTLVPRIKYPKVEVTMDLLRLIANLWINPPAEPSELAGYMRILCKLLKDNSGFLQSLDKDEKSIIFECICNQVFGFSTGITRPRQCDLNSILKYALELLCRLLEEVPETQKPLLDILVHFHEEQAKAAVVTTKSIESASKPDYVGLTNFGCTCYINSFFQQLFMMPNLRSKLLHINCKELEMSKDCDKVLVNLQRTFNALSESKEQYYSPKEFCNDFKDLQGNPINLFQQQDVDEFFNHLAEKVESELALLNEKQIFNEEFEITVTCEITSLESAFPYSSKSTETHLSLPLMIKGCKSIEEGLTTFTRGDILDGDNKYYCEKYSKSLKANKRSFIKKLSQTVIINLKRFEFDRNTSRRRKLNDFCEFPQEIDFYKWTQDGQMGKPNPFPKEFRYTLVGVLIHSGSTEGGHYYSFIKERNPKSANYGKWFEFNDTIVSPFDLSELKTQAFGDQRNDSLFGTSTNAYLLFYEKEKGGVKAPAVVVPDSQMSIKIVFFSITIVCIQYLSDEYKRFMENYVKNCKNEEIKEFDPAESDPRAPVLAPAGFSTRICKLALDYIRDLHGKGKAEADASEILKGLQSHARVNIMVCMWLVKYMRQNKRFMLELILKPLSENLRRAAAELILIALLNVAEKEKPYLDKTEKLELDPKKIKESEVPLAASVRLVKTLLNRGLKAARNYWERFDQFFGLLADFSKAGPEQVRALVKYNAVYKLIDFISNQSYPLKTVGYGFTHRVKMGDLLNEPSFRTPVNLLSFMIRSCSTEPMRKLSKTPKNALFPLDSMPTLPEDEIKYIFCTEFDYLKSLKGNLPEWINLLLYISWKNETTTARISSDIAKQIFKGYYFSSTTDLYLELLKALLTQEDEKDVKVAFNGFLDTRINTFSTTIEKMQEVADNYNSGTLATLECLIKVADAEGKVVKEGIKERRESFKWVLEWLEPYKRNRGYVHEESRKKRVAEKFAEILGYTEEEVKSIINSVKEEKPETGLKFSENLSLYSTAPIGAYKSGGILESNNKIKTKSEEKVSSLETVSGINGKEENSVKNKTDSKGGQCD